MLLAIAKIVITIITAVAFVWTGGAVFTDWGKKHKALAIAAGIVAIAGGFFLFDDIKGLVVSSPDAGQVQPAITGKGDAELKGAPVETEVISLGQSWRGWTYEKRDATYAGFAKANKKLDRLVRFYASETPKIKIFSQGQSNWIAVVGLDVDGKETAYYVDQSTGKVLYTPNEVKDVFWSPSGRYIVSLCGGEVDYFALLDTETGQYFTGNAIEDKSGSYYVRSAPLWPKSEDFFVATMEQWSRDRMSILKTIRAVFSVPKLAWKSEKT